MKKLLLIITVVLVLATGCANRDTKVTPAPTTAPTDTPTNTPTKIPASTSATVPTTAPTNTPTNTPTKIPASTPATVPTTAPVNTPTNTPTPTAVSTPSPTPDFVNEALLDSIIAELKQFVGTIEYGNMFKAFERLTEGEIIELDGTADDKSELPWGTITGFSKMTTGYYDVISYNFSGGYKYTEKLVKEGMTISEFAKLIEDGSGYNIVWVPESDKPEGTIISIEDCNNSVQLNVAGNERKQEVLLAKKIIEADYLGANTNKTKPSTIVLGKDYGKITSKEEVYSKTGKILRGFQKAGSVNQEDAVFVYDNPYIYYDNEYDADDRLIRAIYYYADNKAVIKEYTYLEDKSMINRFGFDDKHSKKTRIDFYDAVVGTTSDLKTFAGYEIIDDFYSDFSDEFCGNIATPGYFRSVETKSVYRADNTLQSVLEGDYSQMIGTTFSAYPIFTIYKYDESGHNIYEYGFTNYDLQRGEVNTKFTFDAYDRIK